MVLEADEEVHRGDHAAGVVVRLPQVHAALREVLDQLSQQQRLRYPDDEALDGQHEAVDGVLQPEGAEDGSQQARLPALALPPRPRDLLLPGPLEAVSQHLGLVVLQRRVQVVFLQLAPVALPQQLPGPPEEQLGDRIGSRFWVWIMLFLVRLHSSLFYSLVQRLELLCWMLLLLASLGLRIQPLSEHNSRGSSTG